jgi:hypothetical protein
MAIDVFSGEPPFRQRVETGDPKPPAPPKAPLSKLDRLLGDYNSLQMAPLLIAQEVRELRYSVEALTTVLGGLVRLLEERLPPKNGEPR